ncbi:LpqB family beta-propeller domain-containing protein [Corynebacterium tapiri]|uniref:LpqB family beta-propeller domain-containing protein n=1 Tax=Corynebacterium tapiri TaxID=1448266 RepID=UPI001FE67AD9|nr:LpqB family beta-propeller domain-containing protein [Corynebacterium tapiri]
MSSCATLPHNSAPQALRTFEPLRDKPTNLGPTPNQEPDLLLQDFYSASAHPSGNYEGARSFLAPEIADEWVPKDGPLVVDRLFVTAKAGGNANERSFQVRGRLIGKLSDGGAYQPQNAEYEATVVMHKVGGQWRIASLPGEVVIERTELLNHFEPHSLFFFDQSGSTLVADRRWVYADEESLDSVLMTMLMEGPSNKIAPAVKPAAPEGAEFAGKVDGVYTFTGFQSLDQQQRLRFGAQLTWTLAGADVALPYEVALDGSPVEEGMHTLTPDDFADLNPSIAATQVAPLYALSGGVLQSVSSSEATPVAGEFGSLGQLTAADVTISGRAAAVRRVGDKSQLLIGPVDGPATKVLEDDSITRPSFNREGNATWVVTGKDKVVRVVNSTSGNELVSNEVDTAQLLDNTNFRSTSGSISELQLSATGARVAIISDGRLFVGVVTRNTAGARAIVNVEEIATELGGSALSVEWNPDGSLLVGTASPETPVWRVEQDGSAAVSLPAGNISAPVVAVAASATTLYATDELAVRQLPISGAGSGGSWRDVPGLRGVRSAPIVAD